MKLLTSFRLALFALLFSVSSVVSADIVVYPAKTQHMLRLLAESLVTVSFPQELLDAEFNSTDKVIVINRLATYWVTPFPGHGRVRVTVPIQFHLTSWDVGALEKELERLGIKVNKPPRKKPLPKPGTVVSG